MNKEVEQLIDRLKQDSDCEDVYWVGFVDGMNCDVEITSKEMNLLLDYINQLETNRDEAIEYLKKYKEDILKKDMSARTYLKYITPCIEALSILKRGKE